MKNTPALPTDPLQYEFEGVDNLRAMRAASNYNAFLLSEIRALAQPHHVILDFGAGLGDAAGALQGDGYTVNCVEPCDSLRAVLVARDLHSHRGLDTVQPRSIDIVYSLNVLEHIQDDVSIISQIHASLRPGGKAFIYVPAFMLLYSNMDRNVGHVRRYHRGELLHKIRAAGFTRVEKVRYVDSLGFFASLVYALIGARGALTPGAVQTYDRWVFPISRWLDKFTGRYFGKNLLVVMVRE